jgi:hypothetical protein
MAFLGVQSLANPVVIAHEIAHQWFYGLVGSDQIQEPWLDEALAEFAATDLYGEAQQPCEPGPVASPVTAFPARRDTLACGGYGDTIYRGGAALVASVRARLGKDRFDAAMRTYVEQNAGRIATTDDLVGAQAAGGTSTNRKTLVRGCPGPGPAFAYAARLTIATRPTRSSVQVSAFDLSMGSPSHPRRRRASSRQELPDVRVAGAAELVGRAFELQPAVP